jgi:hypothetical protein
MEKWIMADKNQENASGIQFGKVKPPGIITNDC